MSTSPKEVNGNWKNCRLFFILESDSINTFSSDLWFVNFNFFLFFLRLFFTLYFVLFQVQNSTETNFTSHYFVWFQRKSAIGTVHQPRNWTDCDVRSTSTAWFNQYLCKANVDTAITTSTRCFATLNVFPITFTKFQCARRSICCTRSHTGRRCCSKWRPESSRSGCGMGRKHCTRSTAHGWTKTYRWNW